VEEQLQEVPEALFIGKGREERDARPSATAAWRSSTGGGAGRVGDARMCHGGGLGQRSRPRAAPRREGERGVHCRLAFQGIAAPAQ
jgi:hypothetical protein